MPLLKLNINIADAQHREVLSAGIEGFLLRKEKLYCRALNRRPVVLGKYLEATNNRKDRHHRKRAFFSGIELIKEASEADISVHKSDHGQLSWEFIGVTPSGDTVKAHVREDIEGKNKRLYLISTFLVK